MTDPMLIDVTGNSYLPCNGIGLVVRPRNSYWRWAGRFPFHGADIGMGFMGADEYFDWLDLVPRERCMYAVSPDCYPDAVESLRRGLAYAAVIRDMGFPVALVAQDGAERLAWPWGDFDVLFVGGERNAAQPGREWKTGGAAEQLCREARNRGKWVMGRVNSLYRLERARSMGVNSVDGTFIKYRLRPRASDIPDASVARGAAEVAGWLDTLARTPSLPGFDAFEMPLGTQVSDECFV